MPGKVPGPLQPNVGLTGIEFWDGNEEVSLPDDSRLSPIDSPVEAKLQEILIANTFDRVILDAIRPDIVEREILHPRNYYALRDDLIAKFEAALPKMTDATFKAEVSAALEQLKTQSEFHNHGEQYRYALLKG